MLWLETLAPDNWPTLVLVTSRVAGLFLVAPVWSMRAIPSKIRGAVAVLLAFVLLPAVDTAVLPDAVIALPLLIASEVLFGVILGMAAGMFVHAIVLGADVISVQMGLAIARTLLPGSGESSTTVGQLQSLMALALYMTIGGHLSLIVGLESSLRVLQPGGLWELMVGWGAFIALVGSVFSTAMRVAAPIMVAMVLTNLALAILGKAVPQLHVLMVAFPITINVGLIILGASLPFIAMLITGWIDGLPALLDGIIGAFRPIPQVR